MDLTETICHAIDSAKADMTIFDTSCVEAWVTENNPKYANTIIKQLKAYAKASALPNYRPQYKGFQCYPNPHFLPYKVSKSYG